MISKYKCYKCGKEFSQKCHLDTHLNKKNTCEKCNYGCKTKWAWINKGEVNEKCIHINDYNNREKYKELITCNKGHKLVFAEGERRMRYFRHNSNKDMVSSENKLSLWHIDWQSYFPDTEVWFRKESEKQHKDRRADVFIKNHNYIIEIQHSPIEYSEVNCRKEDYELHGAPIIWIIDGNTKDVKLEELQDGSYLITFNESWKYNSFKNYYDFVLLDINDNIFKIPVKLITMSMINVKEYKTRADVVNMLMDNTKHIFSMWEHDNNIKSTLTLWQKGAGNGKTYSIIKTIMENADKNLHLILVNSHSEKEVVKNELEEQNKNGEYHFSEGIITHKDNWIEKYKPPEGTTTKYIVKYKNRKSNRNIEIIIATRDSFYYSLTKIDDYSSNPFENLVLRFQDPENDKIKFNGTFNFAGTTRSINKQTMIWFDEAEDLNTDHEKAIERLLLRFGVDITLVGDKIQGLKYSKNLFTNLKQLKIPNVHTERPPAENINRRIKVRGLGEKLNKLINFKKFELPEIKVYSEEELELCKKPIECINFNHKIYKNSKKLEEINENIVVLIKKFEEEIKSNSYVPEDFMIISPVITGRTELTEIKSKLEELWIKMFDDNEYIEKLNEKKNNIIVKKTKKNTKNTIII